MPEQKQKGRLMRAFKKAVAGSFIFSVLATGSSYFLLKPNVDFDPDKEYKPNKIQREFLSLTAKKYHYLALGDSGHNKPEIQMFALHKDTVRTLADAGKKNYFLEQPPASQPYFDAVRNNKPTSMRDGIAAHHSWLCSIEEKKGLHETFETGSRSNHDMRFISADTRLNNPKQERDKKNAAFNNLSAIERARAAAYILGIRTYIDLYGCLTPKAFILPSLIAPKNNIYATNIDSIDDTHTGKYITSYDGPGVVLFGAAHFFNSVTTDKGNKSLRTILPDNGKSLAVLNIARDTDDKETVEYIIDNIHEEGKQAQMPDAILYVLPPKGNPDGIEIINPEMQKLYDQAKENLRQRMKKNQSGPEPHKIS